MNEKDLVRIQKYFTDCNLMSRRAAEAAVLAGEVTVNGHPAHLGQKILPGRDIVLYRGKPVIFRRDREHTYIVINKPRGYVTTSRDPGGRRCVLDLLPPECGRVYPVGRLDMCSEGILLLTDDGDLANKHTHPGHEIPKVYRVKVAERVTAEQLATLRSPLTIDGYTIEPVATDITDLDETGTVLKMTLFEGRNRQIRKMCAEAGLIVKRLSRVSIGRLKLNKLAGGRWRYLEEEEVECLREATKCKRQRK
ncbi:MAG: rRNA pseudouridine synthase [Clostridia bacterium]|nr:rRNA pseudouridine synthase [Clostridia bacterium]